MFNIGAGEMIVIALILLMAVGPEQLPGLIRRVGRTVSEVKGMTEGLRTEFMSGLEEIERATDPEAWAAGSGTATSKPTTDTTNANPFADSTTAASAIVSAAATANSGADDADSDGSDEAAESEDAEDSADAEDSPDVDEAFDSNKTDGDHADDDADDAGDAEASEESGPAVAANGEGAHAFPDAPSPDGTSPAETTASLADPDDENAPLAADPSVDEWVADGSDDGESSETGERT